MLFGRIYRTIPKIVTNFQPPLIKAFRKVNDETYFNRLGLRIVFRSVFAGTGCFGRTCQSR